MLTSLPRCCGIGILSTHVCTPYTESSPKSRRFSGILPISTLTLEEGFLSSSWHITSKGMFAGSCIGVILLVLSLEFLRRAGKEYDRYIINQYNKSITDSTVTAALSSASSTNNMSKGPSTSAVPKSCNTPTKRFRPGIAQQAVRALLHMMQFAVAYFVMLLAMYYNGYFIICIFIGAFLGFFAFGWESFAVGLGGSDRLQEQATVCCG
jgi:copper transporter 1